MSKQKKIIDIKNVGEFYQALKKEIVVELFNSYDKCGVFEWATDEQKKDVLEFGCAVLSNVYNPIQKRYTQQEKNKNKKIIKCYEKDYKKLKSDQNQKAIECLKEVRQDVLIDNCEDYSVDLNYLVELIDNKIKELEKNNES